MLLGQREYEQPELLQQRQLEHEHEHGEPRLGQDVGRHPSLDSGKDDIR